ncbi:hypothetical protein BJ741DRAFT_59092 [Chytriomyces cf. hyalinus JEL632]|nr:hypothetical protein BJ741DRAFT_59092 [Chytriomyces cf. hyalinus JEL632]
MSTNYSNNSTNSKLQNKLTTMFANCILLLSVSPFAALAAITTSGPSQGDTCIPYTNPTQSTRNFACDESGKTQLHCDAKMHSWTLYADCQTSTQTDDNNKNGRNNNVDDDGVCINNPFFGVMCVPASTAKILGSQNPDKRDYYDSYAYAQQQPPTPTPCPPKIGDPCTFDCDYDANNHTCQTDQVTLLHCNKVSGRWEYESNCAILRGKCAGSSICYFAGSGGYKLAKRGPR